MKSQKKLSYNKKKEFIKNNTFRLKKNLRKSYKY